MGYRATGKPAGRPRLPRPGEASYTQEQAERQDFRLNRQSVKALYEKYYASIEEDDENPFVPPAGVVKKIREHFRKHPFDKLKWGLLKLESKLDGVVYMECNAEQKVLLEWCIDDWDAGRPIRQIVLKARQIGITTFYSAATYCILSTQDTKHANCVADLIEKCENQLAMFNTFHEEEPVWVRPEKVREKPITLADKVNKIRKNTVRFESAERRDRVGRSFTFQVGHFTEVAFWPADVKQKVINSLKKCVPYGGGTAIFEESTGNDIGDVFYKRWWAAFNGALGGYRAVFFAVQTHEEYRKPLESGMTPEMFFELLSEQDKERMQAYNVCPEFMNWYVSQRAEELTEENITELLFCREFPMSPEEAFLGANSNFFDVARCKSDQARTTLSRENKQQRMVRLEELPESSSFLVSQYPDGKIRYAKCYLQTDWERRYTDVKFLDAEDVPGRDCLWQIWELPRPGHEYIISGDPSSGKLKVKNVKSSLDNAALGIWRKTYDDRERKGFVQVGQLVAKGIGPKELAREAYAASIIYSPQPRVVKSLIVVEANNHGIAFIDNAVEDGANLYKRRQYGQYREVIAEEIGFLSTTGGATAAGAKMVLYSNLRQAHNHDLLVINSYQTALEFGVFAETNGKLEAISPNHDDTVTEAALFIEGVRYEDQVIAPKRIEVAQDLSGGEDDDEVYDHAPKLKRRKWIKGKPITVGGGDDDAAWGI